MKLDELKQLSSFSGKASAERKNKIYVSETLDLMNKYYLEIKEQVDIFDEKSEKERHIILGFLSNTFNKYTQSFMDVMDVVLAKENSTTVDTSLRSYCRNYLSMFDNMQNDEEEMVAYLVARNEIIHDYINADLIEQEEFDKFYNYVDGLLQINKRLSEYLTVHNLMEVEIR